MSTPNDAHICHATGMGTRIITESIPQALKRSNYELQIVSPIDVGRQKSNGP